MDPPTKFHIYLDYGVPLPAAARSGGAVRRRGDALPPSSPEARADGDALRQTSRGCRRRPLMPDVGRLFRGTHLSPAALYVQREQAVSVWRRQGRRAASLSHAERRQQVRQGQGQAGGEATRTGPSQQTRVSLAAPGQRCSSVGTERLCRL